MHIRATQASDLGTGRAKAYALIVRESSGGRASALIVCESSGGRARVTGCGGVPVCTRQNCAYGCSADVTCKWKAAKTTAEHTTGSKQIARFTHAQSFVTLRNSQLRHQRIPLRDQKLEILSDPEKSQSRLTHDNIAHVLKKKKKKGDRHWAGWRAGVTGIGPGGELG